MTFRDADTDESCWAVYDKDGKFIGLVPCAGARMSEDSHFAVEAFLVADFNDDGTKPEKPKED